MAYGLDTRVLVEGTAAEPMSKRRPIRSSRAWQALNKACRLAIIEEALRAANDGTDEFPLAL